MKERTGIAKRVIGFVPVMGLIAGLLLGPSPAAATTFLVVNDGTLDLSAPCNTTPTHATIELALNAANPGETIAVCPGIYNEDITISKPNLTLDAVKGDVQLTGLVGTQEGVVDIFGAGVTLHGFQISSVNQSKWGVRLLSGSAGSKIDGNQVNQNDFGGILVESGNNEILNNEANTNGGNGIQVDSGSTGNKVHSNLTNFIVGYIVAYGVSHHFMPLALQIHPTFSIVLYCIAFD